jgi:predicted PurR-regulated permease PerM
MNIIDNLKTKIEKISNPTIELTVSNKTIVQLLTWAFAAYLTFSFVNKITHVLVLMLTSMFLAIALNPIVSWLSHKLPSKSRTRATLSAYLLIITFLIVLGNLIVPPLFKETSKFVKDLPRIIQDVKTQDSTVGRNVRKYKLDSKIDGFANDLSSRVSGISGPAFSTAGKVASTVTSILTVLVLTFMMLIEGPRWISVLWRLHRDNTLESRRKAMLDKMYRVVTSYINGQVLIALIAAVIVGLALYILKSIFNADVNPLPLSGLVFLCALIPMIGNLISAVVVISICMLSSIPLAISIGLFILVYQQIENVTLQPYIQAKNNELTPLLVFVAALLGASFGGLLGAFAAIPAMGCAKIFIEDYLDLKGIKPRSLK